MKMVPVTLTLSLISTCGFPQVRLAHPAAESVTNSSEIFFAGPAARAADTGYSR